MAPGTGDLKQTLRKLRGWGRWSHVVADYYPVHPKPRWGHGRPAHPGIEAALERWRPNYEQALSDVARYRDLYHSVPYAQPEGRPQDPYWDNYWFTGLDACALMGLLRHRAPARYLEIGSGHSTMFARYAIDSGGLKTTITSVDPRPRKEIDVLCDQVVRQPLEDCDLEVFDQLEAGDMLFYDGSHRVFTNSDVTVFFLEVLPRLKPGVLVHVHDIFLPDDYPTGWNDRLYSEQYLLAAMLICTAPPFQVVLPNYFVATDPVLGPRVNEIARADPPGRDIPLRYNNGADTLGGSFWVEMTAP